MSGGHVAVLAFPFGTHASPLLNLVKQLANSSPDVIFSFFSTTKSNAFLFKEPLEFDNIKVYDVHNGIPEGYVFKGKPMENIELFLQAGEENFLKSMEVVEKEVGRKVSCVLADAFLWFACEIAERAGKVPWVALWTSGAAPLSTHIHTNLIRETAGRNWNKDDMVSCVPGLSNLSFGNLPLDILCEELKGPFFDMLYKLGQYAPRASAVVINSFEELDPIVTNDLKSKIPKFLNIGPFNLMFQQSRPPPQASDDYNCVKWLDQQEPGSVAYIGFGTVAKLHPDEIQALAEGLEASKIPFLWSLKQDLMSNLPEGFVERTMGFGKIVPWTPQVQVLAHPATAAFLTHCGWNSILEAIVGGVPLIGRPFFGDQHINVAMVERVWRIGVGIEGGTLTREGIKGGTLTKDGAIRALQLVLSTDEGSEMKKRVGVLRELAHKAVEPNGSSTHNFETLKSLML